MHIKTGKYVKAFTLIEILVVVSIIGLISSVAFLRIEGARARSRDAVREQQIRQIDLATRLYIDENGYPPLTGCQAIQTNGIGPSFEDASACFAVSTAGVDVDGNSPWKTFKQEISGYIASDGIDDSLGYVYAGPLALQYECWFDGTCEYDDSYFNDLYALYSDFESNDNSAGNISSSDADNLDSAFNNGDDNGGSSGGGQGDEIFDIEYVVDGNAGFIAYGLNSSCPPDCFTDYEEGESVTIEAVPDSESEFVGWSGDSCSGTNPECSFIVEGDDQITASFAPAGGNSSIDDTPPVISNINSSGDVFSITIDWQTDEPATSRVEYDSSDSYSLIYNDNTLTTDHVVTIYNLSPSTVYSFRVMSVDESGNESQYQYSSVETQNNNPSAYSLDLDIVGNGSLLVSVPGSGETFNCDGPNTGCSFPIGIGYEAYIYAGPIGGATFVGWSGASCQGDDTECSVIMNANRSATATFSQ